MGADSGFVFTEGNKGSEAAGVGSHQIFKRALLLPLLEKYQWLFVTLVIFCASRLGSMVSTGFASLAIFV